MVELSSFLFWKDFQVHAQNWTRSHRTRHDYRFNFRYELRNHFQKAGFKLGTCQGSNSFTTLATKTCNLELELNLCVATTPLLRNPSPNIWNNTVTELKQQIEQNCFTFTWILESTCGRGWSKEAQWEWPGWDYQMETGMGWCMAGTRNPPIASATGTAPAPLCSPSIQIPPNSTDLNQ